jgi:hypothetical protein
VKRNRAKEGMEFKCGCGNPYRSYMALYSHIKEKHDGNSPEGTVTKTGVVPMKGQKKGRPLKMMAK